MLNCKIPNSFKRFSYFSSTIISIGGLWAQKLSCRQVHLAIKIQKIIRGNAHWDSYSNKCSIIKKFWKILIKMFDHSYLHIDVPNESQNEHLSLKIHDKFTNNADLPEIAIKFFCLVNRKWTVTIRYQGVGRVCFLPPLFCPTKFVKSSDQFFERKAWRRRINFEVTFFKKNWRF